MRRVAADHAAERDHRVHRTTGGEHLGGQRQFEGAGHALEQQARRIAAMRAPGLRGAVDELIDQRRVETRGDDDDATLAGVESLEVGEGTGHGRGSIAAYSAT